MKDTGRRRMFNALANFHPDVILPVLDAVPGAAIGTGNSTGGGQLLSKIRHKYVDGSERFGSS